MIAEETFVTGSTTDTNQETERDVKIMNAGRGIESARLLKELLALRSDTFTSRDSLKISGKDTQKTMTEESERTALTITETGEKVTDISLGDMTHMSTNLQAEVKFPGPEDMRGWNLNAGILTVPETRVSQETRRGILTLMSRKSLTDTETTCPEIETRIRMPEETVTRKEAITGQLTTVLMNSPCRSTTSRLQREPKHTFQAPPAQPRNPSPYRLPPSQPLVSFPQ